MRRSRWGGDWHQHWSVPEPKSWTQRLLGWSLAAVQLEKNVLVEKLKSRIGATYVPLLGSPLLLTVFSWATLFGPLFARTAVRLCWQARFPSSQMPRAAIDQWAQVRRSKINLSTNSWARLLCANSHFRFIVGCDAEFVSSSTCRHQENHVVDFIKCCIFRARIHDNAVIQTDLKVGNTRDCGVD